MRVPCLPPLLFAFSPHKASRPAISSVSGCLGRPRRGLESPAGEGALEQETRVGTPENPTGIGRPVCQSCFDTVARNVALAELAVSPSSRAPPVAWPCDQGVIAGARDWQRLTK